MIRNGRCLYFCGQEACGKAVDGKITFGRSYDDMIGVAWNIVNELDFMEDRLGLMALTFVRPQSTCLAGIWYIVMTDLV